MKLKNKIDIEIHVRDEKHCDDWECKWCRNDSCGIFGLGFLKICEDNDCNCDCLLRHEECIKMFPSERYNISDFER